MFHCLWKRRQPWWLRRFEEKVDYLMSTFEDLQAALAAAGEKITAVKADTENLLAKITELQNNPPSGMTPEQQASLDAAVTTAQGIAGQLSDLDALVPDVSPNPTPEEPAPTPEQPTTEDGGQPA